MATTEGPGSAGRVDGGGADGARAGSPGAPPGDPDPRPPRPLSSLRSFLFFPAVRPRLFAKAVASGADGVCIDLEDAVGPERKDEAREAVAALLGGEGEAAEVLKGEARGEPAEPPRQEARTGPRSLPPLVMVRVNSPVSEEGARDLETLAGLESRPDAVVVPKIGGAADVVRVDEALSGGSRPIALLPLVETVRCLAAVEEVAAASERVGALMHGGHDLAIELGARPEWEPLLHARSRVVHAAALAGIGAMDMPLLDLSDPERLRREARKARAMGFSGKAAIHPDQVAPIQEIFFPGPDEVEEARRIVRAYEESGGAAALLDGRVVDRPVLEAARRTLARAGES